MIQVNSRYSERTPARGKARPPGLVLGLLSVLLAGAFGALEAQDAYFPAPGSWETRRAVEVGMDSAALRSAVEFALANESEFGRDTSMRAALEERLASGPHGEILGPLENRGEPNGLVVKDGYIVAEWGDTEAVDMTFSVTKSFLSTTAGVAWARGLIALGEPVRRFLDDPSARARFDSERDRRITWHHLLTQTSEWEGELWGKPDLADRRRGADRELREPGTFWEYNDVRVNLTAFALAHVFGRSLPAVLEEHVMDPIGASDRWRWHGYRNSWMMLDGRRVQSVSGGGHWGGGLWIGTRDQARFGLLHLRDGRWMGREVLSPSWIRQATTPSEVQPTYGYMWWLNTDGEMWPGVPAASYAALGAGTNAIWIDPEHDLVVVVRWIEGDVSGRASVRVLDRGAPGDPTVVLVHGFPLDGRMWDAQTYGLPERIRVIVPDLRGFGRTPAGDGQTTMELLVDDLFRVLDALDAEPAVLVGLSMGGYLVSRAAEREPGRLRGLVLCDTRSASDSDEVRLSRAATLRRVKEEGTAFLVEEFPSKILASVTLESRPRVVETVRDMIRQASPLGVCGALLAMAGRTDTTAGLSRLDVPALVVAGEQDTLTPPADARAMAARIPDADLNIVPDAGHLSPLENPDPFNDALRAFLARLR